MIKEGDLPWFEVVDSSFDFALEAIPEFLVSFAEPAPTPYDVFELLKR
jgi:hypothetical protein